MSGLRCLLQPWHNNVTKWLVITPKLNFPDTGLCACLTQWTNPVTLEAGAMSGTIFETWVMNELLISNSQNGKQAPFCYFRNRDQQEVNVLVEHDGILYPVKCKKTALPSCDTLAGVSALEWLGAAVGVGCAHLYGVGLAAAESQTFTAVSAGVL